MTTGGSSPPGRFFLVLRNDFETLLCRWVQLPSDNAFAVVLSLRKVRNPLTCALDG